jgi:hypothetical protein
MALPTQADRVTRFAGADDPGPLLAVVTPPAPAAARRWSTRRGACGFGGYGTIDLRGGLDASALEPICSAMSGS